MSSESQGRPQVARLIARDYVNRDEALPGVLASPASAVPFIDTWKQLTNVEARCERRQRIYRLSTVIEPSKWPAGRMRRAKSSERELVLRWAIAFDGEVDDEVDEEAEETGLSSMPLASTRKSCRFSRDATMRQIMARKFASQMVIVGFIDRSQ